LNRIAGNSKILTYKKMNTKIFKTIIAIIAVLLTAAGVTAQKKRMYIMEKGGVTHNIVISGNDTIIFHNPYPSVDEGVIINGVKWATRNVATPGYFTIIPEVAGMLYQWNRKNAWSPTGSVTGWDNSYSTDDVWEGVNDPSPAGWHVPAPGDFQKLLDTNNVSRERTTVNGTTGWRFTDKKNGNSIFLPAAGCRSTDGKLGFETVGYYWCNGGDDRIGYSDALNFTDNMIVLYGFLNMIGCNIRPVAD
jgi:uncharacterized protein (TIGR02145 family)